MTQWSHFWVNLQENQSRGLNRICTLMSQTHHLQKPRGGSNSNVQGQLKGSIDGVGTHSDVLPYSMTWANDHSSALMTEGNSEGYSYE